PKSLTCSIYSPFKNFLLQYTQFYLISQRNLQNDYKIFTLATTFSTVKPYSSTTLSPFAEAPKQSIDSTSPSKQVRRFQPSEAAISVARLFAISAPRPLSL